MILVKLKSSMIDKLELVPVVLLMFFTPESVPLVSEYEYPRKENGRSDIKKITK
jgi:hypothetical protein